MQMKGYYSVWMEMSLSKVFIHKALYNEKKASTLKSCAVVTVSVNMNCQHYMKSS